MRTGDLPSCQTGVPYKLQLKDRRHGGGLGNDSNNDYGLAPPNRNLVRYMVKRGRGKKEVQNKSKVSNDKPIKDEKRNEHEKYVGSLIRDEEFDSKSLNKSPGSLDEANGNGKNNDTQRIASQSKVTDADNKTVPVLKTPNLDKRREEKTKTSAQSLIGAKDNGKASNPRSPLTQSEHVNTSQAPVLVPGQRALGKTHVRVVVPTELSSVSSGHDGDDEDYERIWSAENSSNSDEEVPGKQQFLDNRSRLKLTTTLRPANNRPSLLSIDDFSKKARNSSGILYKRRQAQTLYSDKSEESKPISVVFSKGPVEIYSRGPVEFSAHNTPALNSHHQKVNVIGRRNTIHNPGRDQIEYVQKQNYGHVDKTVYKQSSRQPRRGMPPMKLPPISAPSGHASAKKENYKIGDFTSQRHSSEEYALW